MTFDFVFDSFIYVHSSLSNILGKVGNVSIECELCFADVICLLSFEVSVSSTILMTL